MNLLRPSIVLSVAVCTAGAEIIGGEKASMPPHTHQESRAPQGPNSYTLSFARNGGSTATAVTTIHQYPLVPRASYTVTDSV